MNCLLSTAYWPNLHYIYHALHADEIMIEQYEHYPKQSYRNRAVILSANGPLDLSIPVKKTAPKEFTCDVLISYQENWQIRHWRAITSAYRNSPYFEFFEDEISSFYTTEFEHLIDFNEAQLQTIFKLLKVSKSVVRTEAYEKTATHIWDLRESFHPKIDEELPKSLHVPYYQTFGDKFGFVPNLSILDLLFNTALGSIDYLKKQI